MTSFIINMITKQQFLETCSKLHKPLYTDSVCYQIIMATDELTCRYMTIDFHKVLMSDGFVKRKF